LIKNKEINIYNVINENACNNKINKIDLENNLTKIHYADKKDIDEALDILTNINPYY